MGLYHFWNAVFGVAYLDILLVGEEMVVIGDVISGLTGTKLIIAKSQSALGEIVFGWEDLTLILEDFFFDLTFILLKAGSAGPAGLDPWT